MGQKKKPLIALFSCKRPAAMKKNSLCTFFHALYLSRRPAVAFCYCWPVFGGVFAAYVPQIKAGLDVSDATFGLLLLCNALGLVSSMVVAPAARLCVGRARVAVFPALRFAFSFLMLGFATDAVSFGVAHGSCGRSLPASQMC
jgi:hypothetical protein